MHTTPPRRGRAAFHALGGCLAGVLTLGAATAQAVTLTDVVLAAIPANSGSVNYTVPSAPGVVLNVVETGTATMLGSTLFEYEGLWIGADGTGGRYTLNFNQPVASLSLSFIALTSFAGGPVETLTTFVSSAATSTTFSSSDSSATWSGGVLTPLDEDSRGRLTFTSVLAAGFTSLRFDHVQGANLQGVVIEQIDYTLAAAVPEPATAFSLGAGLLLIGAGALRRQAQAAASAGDRS